MGDLVILLIHLRVTVARLLGPGGARSVVAGSLIVKHQLVIANRSRTRAPRLRTIDRIIIGLCAILILWFPKTKTVANHAAIRS